MKNHHNFSPKQSVGVFYERKKIQKYLPKMIYEWRDVHFTLLWWWLLCSLFMHKPREKNSDSKMFSRKSLFLWLMIASELHAPKNLFLLILGVFYLLKQKLLIICREGLLCFRFSSCLILAAGINKTFHRSMFKLHIISRYY